MKMYNEPIKKITGIAQVRYIKYYNKEENEEFERIFIEKENEEKKKSDKKESKLKRKKKLKNKEDCKDVKEIYGMEVSKIRNLKIYDNLKGKNPNNLVEHKPNHRLQVLKMMEAYNKSPKEKIEQPIIEKHKKERDVKEKQTKRQEMEEFKKSLDAKKELDSAFEEFSRVLVKKKLEEDKRKKTRYRGNDR